MLLALKKDFMFILLLTKAENTAKPTYSQHFLSIEVVQM